ncbi:MAG: MFS transporter [Rhodospirillales bacterium]
MYRLDRRSAGFLFLNLGHAYDHLFMLLFTTVVLALEHEPGFADSYGSLIALSVWGFVAFGAGSLPAGWLGDRWSRKGMMIVFFIGIGLASIMTGLADGPLGLGLGLLLIGMFASIYHPVGIAMVADNARQLGKELGVNGVFGNLGVACAGITAGFLIDTMGWRSAFVVPGMVSVATGIAFALFVRSDARAGAKTTPTPHVAASAGEIKRVFAIMILATMCGGIIFNTTTISLPKVFDERLGELATSASGVGGWVFMVFAVAAVAQVVVGHLLDRYPLRFVFIGVVVMQVPMLAVAAVATGGNMLAIAVVMMLLVFGQIPIHDTIVARYTTSAWRSRIYAVKFVLSLGVAAAAVPMVAYLHDGTGGFYWVFMVLAVMAAVVTALAFAMPARRPQPVAAE